MLSNLLSNKIHLSRFYFIINIASKFLMIEFIVWLLLLALSEAIWDAQKWLYSLRFDLRVWELSKTGLDFAVDAWNCVDWFWPSFMRRFFGAVSGFAGLLGPEGDLRFCPIVAWSPSCVNCLTNFGAAFNVAQKCHIHVCSFDAPSSYYSLNWN